LNLAARSIIFGATSFSLPAQIACAPLKGSEGEALERVAPGKYSVTLDTGKGLLTKDVTVRKETQGVQKLDVRK
jgi:hypothetical protein